MGFWSRVSGLFQRDAGLAESRKRRLEEGVLGKTFALTKDTGDLAKSLENLQNNIYSAGYSMEEVRYISTRFHEKARLIRKSYSCREFDYMADKFEKTAQSIKKDFRTYLSLAEKGAFKVRQAV